MQWLAEICVKRPVFTWVIAATLVVVGAASIFGLGVDRFPNIDFPGVVITTVLPGASPEQVETEVSEPIEEAVNTVSGIDILRSKSYEGLSVVFVAAVFEPTRDEDLDGELQLRGHVVRRGAEARQQGDDDAAAVSSGGRRRRHDDARRIA